MTTLALMALATAVAGQPATPERQAGAEQVNPADGAVMVWVPGTRVACAAGTFLMGTTSAEVELLCKASLWPRGWETQTGNERPAHPIELTGYWIYRNEVTNAQYAQFLDATGRPAPKDWADLRMRPELPVAFVTWDDAAAYASWAGGQLPTEAQWEYAARGPEGRLFPWGNEWQRTWCVTAEYHAQQPITDGNAWQNWSGSLSPEQRAPGGLLRPVGSFPEAASWCGALDMAGNVWEWCRDWYEEAVYASQPAWDRDPECTNAASGGRVLRGGGCVSFPPFARTTYRRGHLPETAIHDLGFRVVVLL
jgi:formylglycine-generating enzyme